MGCTLRIVLNEHISTHFTQQIFKTFTNFNIFSDYSSYEDWKPVGNGAPILKQITIIDSDERRPGYYIVDSWNTFDKRYAFSLQIAHNTTV